MRLKSESNKVKTSAGYGRLERRAESVPWPPQGKIPANLLELQVTGLDLPVHMMTALSNINVRIVRDLIAQPEATLVRVLGKRRFKDIQDKLKEIGIEA